ncbi:MAG: DNA polymerase III subunit beta [Chloroflexota bacterium]|nr:MAG: DNA polymerase III subunit beta [Chloroflexota bacterium]
MKLSSVQENLARGLAMVGRAVATRNPLPVTSNVLLATDEGRLKLAGTNLDIAITCWISAKVDEEGAITVPARLLAEFVNSLPNDRVDMKLAERQRSLNLKCGAFEANIKGIDAEEFPPIPNVGSESPIAVDAGDFRDAIDLVAFAAASDDSRPVLAGVSMTFEGDKLVLAAADGFRLAVREMNLPGATLERVSIIVPARALQELSRLIQHTAEVVDGGDGDPPKLQINVTPNRNQVLFRMTDVQLVSRLIEGAFPNYQQIIPKSHTTRVIVSTKEFLGATRIASYFARDSANIVRLHATPGVDVAPGQLQIAATAAEVGDTAGSIDAAIEGEDAQIAFNAKYLSDVLGVIDAAQVALEVTGPSSPGVIRPLGTEGYTHVIMPMHVAR